MAAALALAAGALAAGCGGDGTVIYDCCVSSVHYTCLDSGAYGKCVSTPPDVSGCTLQVDACPPNSNRSPRNPPS